MAKPLRPVRQEPDTEEDDDLSDDFDEPAPIPVQRREPVVQRPEVARSQEKPQVVVTYDIAGDMRALRNEYKGIGDEFVEIKNAFIEQARQIQELNQNVQNIVVYLNERDKPQYPAPQPVQPMQPEVVIPPVVEAPREFIQPIVPPKKKGLFG